MGEFADGFLRIKVFLLSCCGESLFFLYGSLPCHLGVEPRSVNCVERKKVRDRINHPAVQEWHQFHLPPTLSPPCPNTSPFLPSHPCSPLPASTINHAVPADGIYSNGELPHQLRSLWGLTVLAGGNDVSLVATCAICSLRKNPIAKLVNLHT